MKNDEQKLQIKSYSHFGLKKLNKILKLRIRQITNAESGMNTTNKTLDQLRYEKEAILNEIMEKTLLNGSDK